MPVPGEGYHCKYMIGSYHEFSVPVAWLCTVFVIAAARIVRLGGSHHRYQQDLSATKPQIILALFRNLKYLNREEIV